MIPPEKGLNSLASTVSGVVNKGNNPARSTAMPRSILLKRGATSNATNHKNRTRADCDGLLEFDLVFLVSWRRALGPLILEAHHCGPVGP
jgi:hypothetical protein